jgi:hypothetical protein
MNPPSRITRSLPVKTTTSRMPPAYSLRSSDGTGIGQVWVGDASDVPVVGDYDGERKADVPVYPVGGKLE